MLGWLRRLISWWQPDRGQTDQTAGLRSLQRVILTAGVAQTLFDDYAEHRQSERGGEEIGWVLLGLRHGGEAIALAALPAGAERDAGAAHVQFNSDAQALASRILRQYDKRLQIIGVVHTHPGTMRYPSDGDLFGDRQWVGRLRGGEGVFAIGTADGHPAFLPSPLAGEGPGVRGDADHPRGEGEPDLPPHQQIRGASCFSWYVLGVDDAGYRPLPVHLVEGSDLAQPLRNVWDAIEASAPPLNRLFGQLAKIHIEVIDEAPRPVLCVRIPLAQPNQQLRLLLNDADARYYWDRDGELIAIDPHEPQCDRAVYLILAELAKVAAPEARTLVESRIS